jgi:hypothetical protein
VPLLGGSWSLGLELGLEHTGAEVAEIPGMGPIDDYAAIAELSALKGPLFSHV